MSSTEPTGLAGVFRRARASRRAALLAALAGLAAALAALLLALPARAAGEFKYKGFFLPGGAVKIDEDRFRLLQTWDDMRRFYRTTYPPAKFPRRTLRNQAGVRAIHLSNPGGGEWEGANIYENGRGEVRVYVLGRAEEKDEKPQKGEK